MDLFEAEAHPHHAARGAADGRQRQTTHGAGADQEVASEAHGRGARRAAGLAVVSDVLRPFDVPEAGSGDAAATQIAPRPPSESVEGQQSFEPLPAAGNANAPASVSQAPRGRGRPRGTDYYSVDALRYDEMRELLTVVPTLRAAARAVAPHAHNFTHAEPESVERRLTRGFRAHFST
jgi:hypothetical protein